MEGNKTSASLWMKLATSWPRAKDMAILLLATDIPMCAAISENGGTTQLPSLGPYNTHFIFLDLLYSDLISEHERGLAGPHLPTYILFEDNVTFHRGLLIRECFTADPKMVMVFLH